MNQSYNREVITRLIKQEVTPAIGCTEPIAVAYAVAYACELAQERPDKIALQLSGNILKNAMGVGIPGTTMTGLPIAIALGALVGKSTYGLEVLRDATPHWVEQSRRYVEEQRISIEIKEGISEKLYIEVDITTPNHTAKVIVAQLHTQVVFAALDGVTKLSHTLHATQSENGERPPLSMEIIYHYITQTPLEEMEFILESAQINKNAAEQALQSNYGHNVGRLIMTRNDGSIFGASPYARILAYTSAACDARMAGAMIPVMSNSGSGNQGIAVTLPVVIYAEEHAASHEQLVRALTLSHLTAIYIKQHLGRLSALCGCVVAATGSSCGITYLMGGDYAQITYAIKNMIANLTGMICDGAKPSCSLKLSSGVSTAILSAMLAMEGECVSASEGIIDEDVDLCIQNLTRIGCMGMNETDRVVLDIMTSKC